MAAVVVNVEGETMNESEREKENGNDVLCLRLLK